MSTPQELAKPIRQRRLYEQIAERLSKAIDRGDHPAGDRLPPERELAARFEVGRPTIREALIIYPSGAPVVKNGTERGNARYRKLEGSLMDLAQIRRSHPSLKGVVPTLASLLAERKN